MKKLYFLKVLISNYCRLVFLISAIAIFFLTPRHLMSGWFSIIVLLFILATALVVTCFVRNIKERILLTKHYKGSTVGLIATIFGLVALQTCGLSAPVCGASIGVGILAILIPGFSLNHLHQYSEIIIIIMLLVQIGALYFMNCFKKVWCKG